MDKTIFVKDRLVALARDLEQGLNLTSEQVVLAARGAFAQLEKEADEQSARLNKMISSVTATCNALGAR